MILQERRQRSEQEAQQVDLERSVAVRTQELSDEVRERRAAEAHALAEKRRAEDYLDIAEALIVELDAEGRVIVLNQRGCDLLGVSAEAARGSDWFALAVPRENRVAMRAVLTDFFGGAVHENEHIDGAIVDRTGAHRVLAWHITVRRVGGRGASHAGFIPGQYVKLAVSDDGSGMDKATLAHIFEPFFTTKGRDKGTGLGLAMVHGVVRQNEGFINVYSEPGRGTTFSIYLPRHVGDESHTGTHPRPRLTPMGQEIVLVVEDEPAILTVTAKMLRLQGYTVLPAGSAAEALRLATEHVGAIDLLLTDVVMPEMNGRDLAGLVMPHHPGMRLMFMSGYTANVIAHQGVLDEGTWFIQKPFSLQALAAKVREVLDAGLGDLE